MGAQFYILVSGAKLAAYIAATKYTNISGTVARATPSHVGKERLLLTLPRVRNFRTISLIMVPFSNPALPSAAKLATLRQCRP
jgi:hypothetical protein